MLADCPTVKVRLKPPVASLVITIVGRVVSITIEAGGEYELLFPAESTEYAVIT